MARVSGYDVPYPVGMLEDRYVPDVDRVVAAVRRVCGDAAVTAATIEFRLPDVGEGLEEGEIVTWLVAAGRHRRPGPAAGRGPDRQGPGRAAFAGGRPGRAPGGSRRATSSRSASCSSSWRTAGRRWAPPRSRAAAAPGGDAGGARSRRRPGAAAAPEPGHRPAGGVGRPKAAPAVRKLAVERGVDLAAVKGTGPGGRILATDVEALAAGNGADRSGRTRGASTWAEADMARPEAGTAPGARVDGAGRQPLRGIRRVTAEAMARSWSEIPHITAMDEIDATGLLDARRRAGRAARRMAASPDDAADHAGRPVRGRRGPGAPAPPALNASLDLREAGEHRRPRRMQHRPGRRHRRTACSCPSSGTPTGGPCADLAAEIGASPAPPATARSTWPTCGAAPSPSPTTAASAAASPPRSSGPPEVGIMGFGAIRPRPFVVDGEVVARRRCPGRCSADHRLIDGDLPPPSASTSPACWPTPIASWPTAGRERPVRRRGLMVVGEVATGTDVLVIGGGPGGYAAALRAAAAGPARSRWSSGTGSAASASTSAASRPRR